MDTPAKPALEPSQMDALLQMRPDSRRRMGTGKVMAVGDHGAASMRAFLIARRLAGDQREVRRTATQQHF
jgi:hypothetical protein